MVLVLSIIHLKIAADMSSFLAFGVGLDPRQSKVFGPKLGPFLVACSLGLISFSSVGLAAGYPGVGMNPSRCFAFAVARDNFRRKQRLRDSSFPVVDMNLQINGYGGWVL